MSAIAVKDAELGDRLSSIEEELLERRANKPTLEKKVEDARKAYANGGYKVGDPEFEESERVLAERGENADRIDSLSQEQAHVLKLMSNAGGRADRAKVSDRTGGASEDEVVWRAAEILADAAMRDRLTTIANSRAKFGSMELGEVQSRDQLVAAITGTTSMRRGDYQGVLPQLRRRLSVLDLIPTGTMDQNSIPYTRESGSLDGALETAEATAKPEGAVTFTDDEAFAKTIAVYNKHPKQVLADFPAMQGIMGSRLQYQVLRRLEKQIVNGDGTGQNIRGVRNTTGIGATAFVASTLKADMILKGITAILLADGEPTGLLLNPLDWADTISAKATGDGHYYSNGPFESTPQVIWGVRAIPTVAVPQNDCLVGDWEIAAQLFIREGVHLLISDNDADDFTNNRVTLLAEMRAALPVWRPSLFNDVALA